jgi:hypothetical protein
VSLRGEPVEQTARLPDGREIVVWVGVPDDGYIRRRELHTVDLELRDGDRVLAVVTTVLEPGHVGQGRSLARDVAHGLESGELEPTASAVEPLADRLR